MDGHAHHVAMPTLESGGHLNDVKYDAFLANDHTLADPQVVTVEQGSRVMLRVIRLEAIGLGDGVTGKDGPVRPAVDPESFRVGDASRHHRVRTRRRCGTPVVCIQGNRLVAGSDRDGWSSRPTPSRRF